MYVHELKEVPEEILFDALKRGFSYSLIEETLNYFDNVSYKKLGKLLIEQNNDVIIPDYLEDFFDYEWYGESIVKDDYSNPWYSTENYVYTVLQW